MRSSIGGSAKSSKRSRGYYYEDLAVDHIRKHGCTVIDRNFYCGQLGEIDLIARARDGELVFVEVRSLSTAAIHPSQVLSRAKRRRLALISRIWLKQNGYAEYKTAHRVDLMVFSRNVGNSFDSDESLDWYRSVI